MNSTQLIRLATEAVRPGVMVDVWEDPDYPAVVLSVTVVENGDTTTYINTHYDEEIEVWRIQHHLG